MSANHGTRRGYQGGCRCFPCVHANAAYMQTYRDLYRLGRLPLGATVSAKETWKRVRALKVEHFTQAEIARRLGLKQPMLQWSPRRVTLRTQLKLSRFYRHVMAEGPALVVEG